MGNSVFQVRNAAEIRLAPKDVVTDNEPDYGLDLIVAIQKLEALDNVFSFVQDENAHQFINVRLSGKRNSREVKNDFSAL